MTIQFSRRTLIGSATAASLAATAGGLAPAVRAQDEAATPGATPTPLGPVIPPEFETDTNWPAENYDLAGTRNVRGTDISTETIGDLGQAWHYPITTGGAFGALTANPSIVGDTIYVQDANANVYALDKETGEERWVNTYDDVVPSGGPNGIAAAYGMLFTTIGGVGDVVALDQETGEESWRTNILGPLNEGITTFPAVHDNKVWVSTIPGSSDGFYLPGQRGVIHVLDAASGNVLWYWDTTTDNLWGNPTVNSGGGFWHPPSFDDDGKAYVPIANPAPYPGSEEWPFASSRPGDNLYTDSVLKMDPDTATLDWYYQVLPHDGFDLDNQLTPVLIDIDDRPAAIASGKHGLVVAIDRDTGEEIWRVEVGTHKNYDRTEFEEDEEIEVWPGTLGGVETQMAWSAEHKLLVFPVVELPTTYTGSKAKSDLFSGTGLLIALNPSDGSVAWQVELATPPYAAATICNDVVFNAGLDGLILGFDVTDGSEVFRFQAPAGINAQAAVSGDSIYFPAGGPLIPSDTATQQPEEPNAGVVALKLGGEVQSQATPSDGADTGTPVEGTPPEDSAVSASDEDATPEPAN